VAPVLTAAHYGQKGRHELKRWLATLIARPATRMTYGVLLISEKQGVGKSTLGSYILAPLLGEWNVNTVSESILSTGYNDWQFNTRLVLIHEIYAGENKAAYDRLKSAITETRDSISKKYEVPYDMDVCCHVFACSNSIRALFLDDADRRWLLPRVTEKTQPLQYWQDLHAWLKDGGLGIIAQWAEDFVAADTSHQVVAGAHAPDTTMKQEVIEELRSDGMTLAYDLGKRAVAANSPKIVLAVEEVREWVRLRRGLQPGAKNLERGHTLRKMLKAAGMQEPERRRGEKRFTYAPGKKSEVVANFVISAEQGWGDIRAHYKRPEDLDEF
jgi:hypothetical protein